MVAARKPPTTETRTETRTDVRTDVRRAPDIVTGTMSADDAAKLLNAGPMGNWFVEQVLPGTSESKAATENLKSIAAAL